MRHFRRPSLPRAARNLRHPGKCSPDTMSPISFPFWKFLFPQLRKEISSTAHGVARRARRSICEDEALLRVVDEGAAARESREERENPGEERHDCAVAEGVEQTTDEDRLVNSIFTLNCQSWENKNRSKTLKKPAIAAARESLTTGDEILQPSQSQIGGCVVRIPFVRRSFMLFP